MARPFTVINPTTIDDSNLVSTTVVENDEVEYNPATTYDTGDRVMITTGYHMIYEALEDGLLGVFPPDNPDKWVEVGPTNAWAAFDESGGTISTDASPMEFVVSGDQFDSIALLDVSGSDVRVQADNPVEGTYYDETYDISDTAIVLDWYDYFVADINPKTTLFVSDIPAIGNSEYTITISRIGGGDVSLGTFSIGKKIEFGFTQYGARAGIRNYGRTIVDEFGRVQFVRRTFAKTMTVNIFMDRSITDSVHKVLSDLRDRPAVYIAAPDEFDMLTIYGRYVDFDIDVTYPDVNYCSLEIEGIA